VSLTTSAAASCVHGVRDMQASIVKPAAVRYAAEKNVLSHFLTFLRLSDFPGFRRAAAAQLRVAFGHFGPASSSPDPCRWTNETAMRPKYRCDEKLGGCAIKSKALRGRHATIIGQGQVYGVANTCWSRCLGPVSVGGAHCRKPADIGIRGDQVRYVTNCALLPHNASVAQVQARGWCSP
jgi:hypothetical protein